jgi:hypothetical protein
VNDEHMTQQTEISSGEDLPEGEQIVALKGK